MENIVHAVHGFPAGFNGTDVAFDQAERRSVQERRDIFPFPRQEVIQADDLVSLSKKGFRQIGTDESGSAGYEDPGMCYCAGHNLPSTFSRGRTDLTS